MERARLRRLAMVAHTLIMAGWAGWIVAMYR